MAAPDRIILIERRADTNGNGFLSDRKVTRCPDLSARDEFPDAFLRTPDTLHAIEKRHQLFPRARDRPAFLTVHAPNSGARASRSFIRKRTAPTV